jgi:hypothetical protein
MSKFKFLGRKECDETYTYSKTLVEIAYQLKRIADAIVKTK